MTTKHLNNEQIQDFVDGNIGPDYAHMAAHIQSCALCAEEVEQYRALCAGLADDAGFELSPDFAKSVAALVEAPEVELEESAEGQESFWSVTAITVTALVAVTVTTAILYGDIALLNEWATRLASYDLGLVAKLDTVADEFVARMPFSTQILPFGLVTLLVFGGLDRIMRGAKHRGSSLFCA